MAVCFIMSDWTEEILCNCPTCLQNVFTGNKAISSDFCIKSYLYVTRKCNRMRTPPAELKSIQKWAINLPLNMTRLIYFYNFSNKMYKS